MEDIIVFTKSPADRSKQVWRVLRLLYEAGGMLILNKYKFFAKTTDYLAHVIRPSRLKLAKHTTDVVTKLELPTTQSELCSYLGLCDIFRRFVQNVSSITSSPNK